MQIKLLIIDDDIDVLSSLGRTFTTMAQGFLVLSATSANEGTAMLKEQRPDVVVLDYLLGEKSGIDLLKDYHAYFQNPANKKYEPRYVVITGHPDDKIKKEVEETYAVDAFLTKPFKTNEIQKAVMAAIQKKIVGFYNQLCPYSGALPVEYKAKNATERSGVGAGNNEVVVKEKAIEAETGAPAKQAETKEAAEKTARKKGSLLIVDDNEDLLESLYMQFHYSGFDVVKTADPERALELASTICPDIIMTDISMPKLDGITMVRRFKEIHPKVKVILMTGYLPKFERNINAALSEGLVNRAIHKPFKALQIEQLVYSLLTKEAEDDASKSIQGKILVVDDEVEVVEFLKDYFEKENFEVMTADCADKALEVFRSFSPDVVITDIKMPGKDGIWIIKEIQSKNKHAKILVMTGQDTQAVLGQLTAETKIVDYFSKPFTLNDIEAMSAKIFEEVVKPKMKS